MVDIFYDTKYNVIFKKVLKGCDTIANNLYDTGIGHEIFVQQGKNGVIYNTGIGSYRINRVWTCLMHAVENIFKPFLFVLIQIYFSTLLSWLE